MKFLRPKNHKSRIALAGSLAALCLAVPACATGPALETGNAVPALKMSVTVQQGRAKIPLRDGMTLRLKRQAFDIHFLARDFGPDAKRMDVLAVAARKHDFEKEKLVGRRRVDTKAFVNGGEAAAHGDRAQSWLILSPYAFTAVYYGDADFRRTDFVESWSDSVMELRFSVRYLLIDDKDLSRPSVKALPGDFPPRLKCIFFMDLDNDGIVDADEIMRVSLEFEPRE